MSLHEYEIELFKRIQEFASEWETTEDSDHTVLPSDMSNRAWDDQFACWGEQNGNYPTGDRDHTLRQGEVSV